MPSCEGDTAPLHHVAKVDDFVKGLVLLDQDGTNDDRSEHNPSVASYIEDEDGSWHPWVKVSRWDGEREYGTAQMYLTVRDPSVMATASVQAEPPFDFDGKDGEV